VPHILPISFSCAKAWGSAVDRAWRDWLGERWTGQPGMGSLWFLGETNLAGVDVEVAGPSHLAPDVTWFCLSRHSALLVQAGG
jgi:hypothetical protein